MSNYIRQFAALTTARRFIDLLPPASVFAVSVTDEDDASVLNIYVASRAAREALADELFPGGVPVDRESTFVTYKVGTLSISIIDPEERKDNG